LIIAYIKYLLPVTYLLAQYIYIKQRGQRLSTTEKYRQKNFKYLVANSGINVARCPICQCMVVMSCEVPRRRIIIPLLSCPDTLTISAGKTQEIKPFMKLKRYVMLHYLDY